MVSDRQRPTWSSTRERADRRRSAEPPIAEFNGRVLQRFIDGQVHWLLGYPEEGLALGRAALVLAERIAHPFSLVSALLFDGVLYLDRGESEAALQLLDAAEALAAEQRLGLVAERGSYAVPR